MKQRIQQFAQISKSALFTLIVHSVLLAAVLAGFWWPFSGKIPDQGQVQPIQAQVISEEEVFNLQEKKIEETLPANDPEDLEKAQEEERRRQEALEAARREEEKKKAEEEERRRQEALEAARREEEKKKAEEEERRRQEALEAERREEEKKKAEEEERRRQEALEAKRREEERKKAEEEERKRQEALEAKRREEERKKAEEEERKRQEALEAKRREEERKKAEEEEEQRKREKELQDQLARTRTRNEAENALAALVDRIAAAAENNWRRPWNSSPGRVALIRVRVARNGEVLSAHVVKSSGDQAFDESGEIAIKKASPLPFPSDPEYYEFIKEFNIKFAPDE